MRENRPSPYPSPHRDEAAAGRGDWFDSRRTVSLFVFLVLAFSARADNTITLRVHEQYTMQVFAVTAAYAVDSTIADAGAQGGVVTIFGRSAGRTKVIVASVTGQSEYEVHVEGARNAEATRAANRSGVNGRIESRIETGVPQVHTTIDVARVEGTKRSEVHVESVHYRAGAGERAATTLPSASYRIFTPGRELTFLDRIVDHSSLTLSSTALRGVHYVGDRWSAHAGYTAYAAYQSFLLPAQRSFVIGGAYAMPLSKTSRVTPGLFVFENGTVGSLLFDHERDGLAASAELGVSRTLAGAVKLALERPNDRVRLDVRYRPREFPGLDFGQPRGFNADAAWSRTFGRGSTADSAFSASDFDLPGLNQRTMTATSNVRLRLTDSLSLLGGASYGRFDDTRSLMVPAGVQYDRPRYGMSALARWSQNDATNRGGAGFRVSARASAGRLFATAYVDYQQQAPTLALIFREQPDLALALEQLGITATTPADIARALRDNSALIALGYIDGVTIELVPERTQGGLEVAWRGAGAARMQLRGRVLFNRNETVSARTDTVIASLTASRRITEATDLFVGYSYWLTHRRGDESTAQASLEVGVRHQFDQVPSLFANGRGTISGAVFLDENIDGTPESGVADAEVELDGGRKVQTASDGTFVIKGVTRGAHRVTARVPQKPDAFFTTPSRVEAKAGDTVRFGVAMTPARVFGRVVSDAGDGVGSIGVTLTRGAVRMPAMTGSDGTFSFAAAPGEWELAIDTGSLPIGYSTTASIARTVMLDRATPSNAMLELRANRSVSGRVAAGIATIRIEPSGRIVPVDSNGNFTVRTLPAGEITLRAGNAEQRLTLPNAPTTIANVTFGTPPMPAAAPPAIAVAAARAGTFLVQLGTFRIRANALELVARARRAGVEPTILSGAQYLVVRTGPFESRTAAASVAKRLTDAGLEAVVRSGK